MRNRPLAISLVIVMLAASSLLGCRAEECRQMMRCCEAIEAEDGVGAACGEMATDVKRPRTCRTILRTVNHMFEERGEQPPAVCQ
jgi:hypothetical protein